MKYLLLFALASCAKQPVENVILGKGAPLRAPQEFSQTTAYSENHLLDLAGKMARARISLNGQETETCLEEEKLRPKVQEVCALLWAFGPTESKEAEAFILKNFAASKTLSTALLARRKLVEGLSQTGLLALLANFAENESWISTRAARQWLEWQPNLSLSAQDQLLDAVPYKKMKGPLDLASAMGLLQSNWPGKASDLLGQYCDKSVLGEARFRCWKAVGALLNETLPEALRSSLKLYLPEENSSDWKLFTRAFPTLANHRKDF